MRINPTFVSSKATQRMDRPKYPIILFPPQVQIAHQAIPPAPIRPRAPQAPKLEEPAIGLLVYPTVGVLMLLVFNILIQSRLFNVVTGFFWLIIVPFLAYFFAYKPRKIQLSEKFKEETSEYKKKLQTYQTDTRLFEAQANRRRTPEEIAAHRRKVLMEELRRVSSPPTKLRRAAVRGRSEEVFKTHLVNRFGKKIRQNMQLGKFKSPYAPDFVWADEENGLFIDIEIDEPYTALEGEPIHFRGADDARNDFFIRNGWLVVRFAEEQIVQYPEACCTQIEQVIAYLLLQRTTLDICVPVVAHWTRKEAQEMAKAGKRNYYR